MDSKMEQMMDEYLDKKEQEALLAYRKRVGLDRIKLPKDIIETVEGAFLIGYQAGSIDGAEEMKNLSKVDPVGFYNWIRSE
ncbi:hypothetical protein [Bacillus sp. UMB0728]|uniref:hypothetical protein n=1 Tax=Bacillus sp. UMB0728 TaxID=2066052 RepID=UPI000C75AE30|nr:hypothetical protein [Bacillus sp. UMB0728]PLR72241.1 hypothetical protein CYJ37_11845 [Bacillus sp. UMB0728]